MDNIYNSIQTSIEEVPQLQTVISDNVIELVALINNPWVEVTSVNGMTGDVVVDAVIKEFEPNHYYVKGAAISHSGKLYYAKNSFNSSTTFNVGDWDIPANLVQDASYVHTDNNYTTNEKDKLSGISAGAQVNTIESIEVNGTMVAPDANKKVSFDTMKMVVSTTDIGEGADLAADTLYVVVGS